MTTFEIIALAVAGLALGFAVKGFQLERQAKRDRRNAAAALEPTECIRPHAYDYSYSITVSPDVVPPKPAIGHASIIVERQEALRG